MKDTYQLTILYVEVMKFLLAYVIGNFCKLDLYKAYLHLEVDKENSEI